MFELYWTPEADSQYRALEAAATRSGSRQAGLFKQIKKTLQFLQQNPKHAGLNCHPYESLEHPFDKRQKVWEAYVQNKTPGAYRVFWCYGPDKGCLTVIAITPHP